MVRRKEVTHSPPTTLASSFAPRSGRISISCSEPVDLPSGTPARRLTYNKTVDDGLLGHRRCTELKLFTDNGSVMFVDDIRLENSGGRAGRVRHCVERWSAQEDRDWYGVTHRQVRQPSETWLAREGLGLLRPGSRAAATGGVTDCGGVRCLVSCEEGLFLCAGQVTGMP